MVYFFEVWESFMIKRGRVQREEQKVVGNHFSDRLGAQPYHSVELLCLIISSKSGRSSCNKLAILWWHSRTKRTWMSSPIFEPYSCPPPHTHTHIILYLCTSLSTSFTISRTTQFDWWKMKSICFCCFLIGLKKANFISLTLRNKNYPLIEVGRGPFQTLLPSEYRVPSSCIQLTSDFHLFYLYCRAGYRYKSQLEKYPHDDWHIQLFTTPSYLSVYGSTKLSVILALTGEYQL